MNRRRTSPPWLRTGGYSPAVDQPLGLGPDYGQILAQTAFIYAPAMNLLFHSEPIGQDEWLLTLGGATAIFGAVGLEKFVRRLLSRRGRNP